METIVLKWRSFDFESLKSVLALFCIFSLLLGLLKYSQSEEFQVSDSTSPLLTAECCEIISQPFLMETSVTEEASNDVILTTQAQAYVDRREVKIALSLPEDVVLSLAKIIASEAANVKDDFWQQAVGYVVMNRVDSKNYPNTIEGVFYSGDAYAEESRQRYEEGYVTDQCIENAKIVLQNYYEGTIPVPKNLVFQSEFPQGETWLHIGNTYFGIDPNLPAE